LHDGNVIENKAIKMIGSIEQLVMNNLPKNIMEINFL
jgi:hypothetical protein